MLIEDDGNGPVMAFDLATNEFLLNFCVTRMKIEIYVTFLAKLNEKF